MNQHILPLIVNMQMQFGKSVKNNESKEQQFVISYPNYWFQNYRSNCNHDNLYVVSIISVCSLA